MEPPQKAMRRAMAAGVPPWKARKAGYAKACTSVDDNGKDDDGHKDDAEEDDQVNDTHFGVALSIDTAAKFPPTHTPARLSLELLSVTESDTTQIENINRLLAVVDSLILDLEGPFTILDKLTQSTFP
jgi:hypothetical protein